MRVEDQSIIDERKSRIESIRIGVRNLQNRAHALIIEADLLSKMADRLEKIGSEDG